MRFLLLAFLVGCVQFKQPVDLIPGRGIMCQPLNVDAERCWDRNNESWMCIWGESGSWSCVKETISRKL